MTYRPRKSRFTREQWEVQRERFHIDPESPMPAEGTAVNISKPVGSLIASLGLAQQSLQHQLMERWENIAGSPLCRHIRPGPSQEGTLTIYVSNSVMLTELS
ncbi:MAG TPA: DciA family protein, partial [Kiritimatiellia bacterium]|nr:DciA family protein [Kiritimatiellia bacterium]